MLTDQADGDYSLCYNSPAVDAGAFVGLPYNNSWPDIGAFETDGSPHPGGTPGAVTGTVTLGGIGLSGVTVSIGQNNCETQTAANGNYTLSNVLTGAQSITAAKRLYTTLTQSASIPAGGTATVNFALALAPPQTYYVTDAGDDSYDGLAAAYDGTHGPWASIDNGDKTGVLLPGDTVEVEPGYYMLPQAEYALIMANCSGTADKPITYTANGDVTIDQYFATHGLRILANYIVIDGFDIINSGYPVELFETNGSTVRNCSVSSSVWAWRGLWINGGVNCKLYNNVVSMPASDSSTPPNQSWGITDDGWNGTNNNFGSGSWIVNNTVHDTAGIAFMFAKDLPGRVFKNNIAYNCGNGVQASGTNLDHSHNMFFDTTGSVVVAGNTGTMTLASTETTTIDPVFVDPTNADPLLRNYNLQPTSPAIDAGAYVGLPFNGNWPDIGAFEYPGTPNTTPIATVTGNVTAGGAGVSGDLLPPVPTRRVRLSLTLRATIPCRCLPAL